jgi:hypothetical protein
MNIRLRLMIPVIFVALIAGFTLASHRKAAPPDARTLLSSLPASDFVTYVDLQRILTEIIPRLLAKDPATLAKMTAGINELKTKTGVNILAIDSVVLGVKFVGNLTHQMNKDNLGVVIIAHGGFDANALIAFLKQETKGKAHEETYGGKIIYSEPQPAPPKKKTDRQTGALSVLDANTVAIGDLPQVRAAIDAFAGKDRVDPTLVQLAERDASSFTGMAGNVPASLLQDLHESAPPTDQMAQVINKAIAGLKQIFGSIGATPTDFNVITGVRLSSSEQAASLSDTLLGLRQQALAEIQDQETRDLVNSLQISAQGDELQIRADIKNEVVQSLIVPIIKDEPKVIPATRVNKQPVKHRRSRRRRRH